jgi:DNA-binding transcriptional MerR regulator
MDRQPSVASLRIGELAGALGLNPKTIRYYEAIGLLPAAQRTSAGYRLYGPADRERLRFIARAKALGLSLAEIADILGLRDGGTCPCDHVLVLLDRKLIALDEQLRTLATLREELQGLRTAASTPARDGAPICAIIEQRHSCR